MSEKSSQLDLSQLAVDRGTPAKKTSVRSKRSWFTKYVLPLGILVGFLGLFGWAARDSFLPAQSITITPVVVSRAEIKQEGTPLFQAAGWVEPRPTPVTVSALAPGVIEDLLVIEGQQVKKGEAVARLINTDANLALAEAKASHTMQEAEVRRAEGNLIAAKTNLAMPVSQQAALADAEAMLSQVQRERENLPFAVQAARTRQQLAAENVRRKEAAGDAITGRVLREAQAELATASNAVRELEAREPTLKAQLESLRQKKAALAHKLRLLSEEKRVLADAEANLAVMKARLQQTQLAVETAELRLQRMVVRSPIAGRVLSVQSRPGQRLSGINPHSEQGSSSVVSLYDPAMLQIRVDVRLEDVPQVLIGQPALIETAVLANSIQGEVISVTTLADIQKNTLQVKVAVIDPPEVIKPEMLGKVTFLAPPSPVAQDDGDESPLRLFVPQSLVASGEQGTTVWLANLTTGIAQQRSIEIASGSTEGGLVEVTSGLQPTDKLIVAGRESVAEGTRVRVTREDRTLSTGKWNPSGGQPATRTASVSN
ncbi:HlyD family efflux transporter periplasmic adaptor subunit [Adhaeretor mobilis]|uniref:Multidrug resistance protein MdtN n=1 Tax=Adhaeretor mobilis TaxID=1930276 RepID=A0A517MQA3_9BACT|nr:HlyD family efflux transporter periplasmic adaptor subunit [Adhaeretor mobilis]QDS97054.1 multidrug resistance protein MdtN [Adhaeretor mobilis]